MWALWHMNACTLMLQKVEHWGWFLLEINTLKTCESEARTKCPKGKQTSSLNPDSTPPKLLLSTLWHFARKRRKKCIYFSFAATLRSLFLSLPPYLCVSERQRNFIEKMEGTGKTRVPGGVLQGFRLHQRLPFSAGRWTHNGKMSVATVTRTSHWLGVGRGGRGPRGSKGWGGWLRHFNNKPCS